MPSTKSVSEILRISQNRLSPFPIDCLYLHWPRSGFDNTAFIREMAALKKEGQINKVGVCNMPLEELRKIVKDGIVPDRIQIPISLLWTRDLAETLAFCKDKKIQIAAYSPTGMGLLSGKYRNSSDLKDARSNLFCFSEQCRRQYLELLDVIEEVARRHNVSCTKVALSWTCAKNPDIILLGARTESQMKENLSDPIELDPSEMSELDNAARKLDEASAGVCDNIFSYRW
jgi:aryl-alcohol dehydrogenase-like predicted oxidoreductase